VESLTLTSIPYFRWRLRFSIASTPARPAIPSVQHLIPIIAEVFHTPMRWIQATFPSNGTERHRHRLNAPCNITERPRTPHQLNFSPIVLNAIKTATRRWPMEPTTTLSKPVRHNLAQVSCPVSQAHTECSQSRRNSARQQEHSRCELCLAAFSAPRRRAYAIGNYFSVSSKRPDMTKHISRVSISKVQTLNDHVSRHNLS
jgi:hypothetical protein